jgi:antiphage defense system Thoeris ThsB-like protein
MRGWKVNERVEFEFRDAHDLGPMTGRAQDEAYVKSELRKRMIASAQVIVLVGESTKNLRKFVGWEIDLAVNLGLPIIVVNLNENRQMDCDRCPVPLRTGYIVHVAYKRVIIRHALENFPAEFAQRDRTLTGSRYYTDETYRNLGL